MLVRNTKVVKAVAPWTRLLGLFGSHVRQALADKCTSHWGPRLYQGV